MRHLTRAVTQREPKNLAVPMIDFSPAVWEGVQSILPRTVRLNARAMLQTDTKLFCMSNEWVTGDGPYAPLTEQSAGFEVAYEATRRRRQ